MRAALAARIFLSTKRFIMSDNALREQARRFLALFQSYEHAHGRYGLKRGSSDSGKVVGYPRTETTPLTEDVILEHFKGLDGAGGLPLMEDNTVFWSALDIDDNSIDHAALSRQIKKLGLPLVVCRSKSGGAHCYVFFKEAMDAGEVRERMTSCAAILGKAGCEIFPKQDSRANKDDIGNWINLPYHNAVGISLRPAYNAEGHDMTLDEFLDTVEQMRGGLPDMKPVAKDEGGLLEEGPPCLQHILSKGGLGEGERNDGMFNVAVYLRKRFPDNWQTHMLKYNMEMCDPPLGAGEVAALEKAAGRKDYGYRCSQHPIKPFCQKRTCLTRKYGVGQAATDESVEITGLTKYQSASSPKVYWGMTIGGGRIMVDTATLYDPGSFNKSCMAAIGKLPIFMSAGKWHKHLNGLLATADIVQLPDDASSEGQIWLSIIAFMTQKAHAREMSEVLTGRPYHKDGKVYFRSQDLFSYLKANRVNIESEYAVYFILREHGVEKKYFKVRSTDGSYNGANLWMVPLPADVQVPVHADAEEVKKEAF
jgi:hypothetical protein